MPFYFEHEGKKLLYTACEKPSSILSNTIQNGEVIQKERVYNAWKIYLLDIETNQTQRIETFQSPEVIECSPAAYFKEGELFISFILNKPESMTLMSLSLRDKSVQYLSIYIIWFLG